jgi:hypothetical protein
VTDPTDPPIPPVNPDTGRRTTMGRPTRLTPEVHERIVQVVAAGNYLKTAAAFVGISAATLQSWLARGRAAAARADAGEDVPDAEQPYLNFLTAVTQAETQAEVAAVTYWRRSFGTDWRAARDYLARKRPEQWAAKTTIALSSEEAEGRIERATFEALTALGVDTAGMGGDLPDLPEDDLPELPEDELE